MAPKSEPQSYEFATFTFKLNREPPYEKTVNKICASFQEVKQWNVTLDGKLTINGEIDRDKVLKCLEKLNKYRKKKIVWESQAGECSTNLKKKEAAPKIDMGPIYPFYGGYYDYGYGYGFPYHPTFGSNNYSYYQDSHLECGGHAADCDSYHMQKRDHSSTSTSSTKPAHKSASSTKAENTSSVTFNKLGAGYGYKEKRSCSIM